jgi:hypothetical protein
MTISISLIPAVLILAFGIMPASAISLDEINTSGLDIPEIGNMNFTDTPLGTIESLLAYSERLISAAEELLKFIESIFEMLDMENNEDVKNLLNILNESKNISVEK